MPARLAPSGTLAATNGGTGQTVFAVGDLLYASTTTALSRLAGVATGNVLISGGVGVAFSWGKVALGSAVSGSLPVANGGTGATTAAAARAAINQGSAALTSGATVATDASTGNVFTLTLGTNATLSNPTNLAAGASYAWIITQDGTGSRTLAYGSAFTWPGGTAPTLSTAAGAVDLLTAIYDGTKLRAVLNKAFA